MKASLFFAVFLVIFSVAFSSVGLFPKVEGKPGHCWTDLTGPMKNGETRDVKNLCAKADCYNDGSVELSECGIAVGPNGATKVDYSKPYPECCPQPI